MPLSVFFSFAELEDIKMKKKNETGTGELWKNNDFPICKTIVRFALYKQHPSIVLSFVRSFLPSFVRSFGGSFGRSFVHSFIHSVIFILVHSPNHLAVNVDFFMSLSDA